MKEQLITFETAKLAKEKGFDKKSGRAWYTDTTLAGHDPTKLQESLGMLHYWNADSNIYEACTQSLLQKWLREKHGIFIFVEPTLGDGDKQEFAVYATNSS